jgi:chromosome segregation ATPase
LSEQKELEKLQAMRAELEAESRLLIEEQQKLEKNVLSLEEQVVVEELKKEKAVIEDLKNRNKAAKDAIADLEAKKKSLQSKLNQPPQEPETPPPEEEKAKEPEAAEAPEPEPAEEAPEEAEDGGVTVTAIEGDALVENPEVDEDSKQEKKKRRFF